MPPVVSSIALRLLKLAQAFSLCGFACCLLAAAGDSPTCNVRDFGAIGDGLRKDSAAFEAAIRACSQRGGGVVLVPPGRYLTGVITLRSHITLEVDSGATILARQDPADYPLRDSVWSGEGFAA
jgi:polygalacturonase